MVGNESSYWGDSSNGFFNVSSAYKLITKESNHETFMDGFSCGCFAKRRHELRHKKGMTDSTACGACNADVESIDHVFRSCPISLLSWGKLGRNVVRGDFLRAPFDVWVKVNCFKENGCQLGNCFELYALELMESTDKENI